MGPVTAAAFVATIDDVHRFRHAHQVEAYRGVVPRELSSGDTQRQVAEGHWRRIDTAELGPLVRAGVGFGDGVQIEPQKKRKKAVA